MNTFVTEKVKSLDLLEENMIIVNNDVNDVKAIIDSKVA